MTGGDSPTRPPMGVAVETCKEHSGICATIQAVDEKLTQFREDTSKNFDTVTKSVDRVSQGFEGFKTWLLYSILGCAFSILTSIVVMVIKLR